ncbi:hypothetical protein [Brucella pseudintermedia]|nr:hypothetical protein [Brucella pseudintermedia]
MKNIVMDVLTRFANWYVSNCMPPHYYENDSYTDEELLAIAHASDFCYWF